MKKGISHIPLWILLILVVIALPIYFLTKQELVKNVAVVSLIVVAVLLLVYIIITFLSKSHKLRNLLKDLAENMETHSVDELKSLYVRAYDLYLKVSEKDKANFYGRLTKIRTQLESHMHSTKKVETNLAKSAKGSFIDQKKNFDEAENHISKLPENEKKKFEQEMSQVKNRLERGN